MKNITPKNTFCLLRVSKLKYKVPILFLVIAVLSSARSFRIRSQVMKHTTPYCTAKITTEVPMSVNPRLDFYTAVSAA